MRLTVARFADVIGWICHGFLGWDTTLYPKPKRRPIYSATGIACPIGKGLAFPKCFYPKGSRLVFPLFGYWNPAAIIRLIVPSWINALDRQSGLPSVFHRPLNKHGGIVPFWTYSDTATAIIRPSWPMGIMASRTDTDPNFIKRMIAVLFRSQVMRDRSLSPLAATRQRFTRNNAGRENFLYSPTIATAKPISWSRAFANNSPVTKALIVFHAPIVSQYGRMHKSKFTNGKRRCYKLPHWGAWEQVINGTSGI